MKVERLMLFMEEGHVYHEQFVCCIFLVLVYCQSYVVKLLFREADLVDPVCICIMCKNTVGHV